MLGGEGFRSGTIYADESIWLTQKMMGALYDVNVRTVSEHLKKIFGIFVLLMSFVILYKEVFS